MARLWSSGFELNSTTAGVEFTTVTNGTIQTTTVRSGTYAGQITSLSSGAARGFLYQMAAAADGGPYFVRFYLRYATAPSGDNCIFSFDDDTTVGEATSPAILLTSSGELELWNGASQVGSTSSALSANTWYRVEVQYDATPANGSEVLTAKIDGVEFAGSSALTLADQTVHSVSFGGNLRSEAQTTGNWYFDDIAINDSTGSFQTSFPGDGEIIHLRPNAAGDNNTWNHFDGADGSGDTTNYEEVDDVTPDDTTTYVWADDGDEIDYYNLDATPAALASDDTINCVQVGVRFDKNSPFGDGPTFKLGIKATSGGTTEEGATISPTSETMGTNAVANPRNYNLTLYDLPGASTTSWTKSDLDTTQVGATAQANNTADTRITAMWLLVDHKSAPVEQEGFAFGDDDGSESAHTLDTQDTNVTEPLGTKTLRALLNATGDPDSNAYKLKYQKNGSGGYTDVPVGATTSYQTGAIEVGDVTESGSNTASGSWPIDHPAAATGDLLIFNVAWDDSTDTTGLTPPSGPNGETAVVIEDVAASSSTAVRGKVVYYIATDTWTAGELDFTPSASEQRTATVIRVPAGEFDASTPIGAHGNNPSVNNTEVEATPAITAGASDGGGRVVAWFATDIDDLNGDVTGWTVLSSVDRGAVGGDLVIRDTVATDSESIAEVTGWTADPAEVAWVSFIYIVRPPADTTNQLYVSTSGNVTAGGEATTARLTAPSGKTTSDFDTGRRWDNENGSDSIDITADDYTELEWVLTTQSPATTDDYFEFRVYNADVALPTYTVTPKWTIGSGGGGPAPTTQIPTRTLLGVGT